MAHDVVTLLASLLLLVDLADSTSSGFREHALVSTGDPHPGPRAVAAASTQGTVGPPAATQVGTYLRWFDVRAFGAKGDGSSDDTAALRAAIRAASLVGVKTSDGNLGSGGVVYLPPGMYRVTGTLTIQHDGVSLVGDGPAASVVQADADDSTDIIRYGPVLRGHSGRRSTVRGLSVYSRDVTRCRDAIVFDDVTWWRIDDVQTFQAGRYGLRVGGTINGTAVNLRTWRSGDSGVFIDKSSGTGTGETTTSFLQLYSAYNRRHGVLIRRGHVVSFYSPTIEFNGQGGDPSLGSGFKIGDRTSDGPSDVWMYAPYFENNRGWDIWAGDVPAAAQSGWVHVYGGFSAGYAPEKAAGYGFLRADYARVHVSGVRLAGSMTEASSVVLNTFVNDPRGAGGAQRSTFRDITAPFSALPTWTLDGAPQPLNAMNSLIEWTGPTGEITQFGRFLARSGGPSSGESIAVTRSKSLPEAGVFGVGDIALNSNVDAGNRALGWRATRAGVAGRDAAFEALWARPWRSGHVSVPCSPRVQVDATAGDWFSVTVVDGQPFAFATPSGAASSQQITITVRNARGQGLTLSPADPFPLANGYRKSGWVQPAAGQNRSITFRYDGKEWVEVGQSAGDVAN